MGGTLTKSRPIGSAHARRDIARILRRFLKLLGLNQWLNYWVI